ncbi:DUF4282 domain-containing protein [Actinomadura logoneensis]|uniref:DUF4282 domain-containing protein n=1 Tax=Actinomadura logoneensis TaxID=2293572 RepID=A0A372JMX8_9ACTN|nr:DUF4282 domain-containing protein [Actinomadura logoneensis]RFU41310.1 DUF4282 domain-containing protein [Actinomadura logoneensis]
MGLLRTLGDTRFRSYATPSLLTWIYRGCLTGIVLVTGWWVLVAVWLMSWRNGWLWGVLLLVVAPVVGLVLLLCVRVALEFVAVKFPAEPRHDLAASGKHGVAPLVNGAVGAARSVIHSRRIQGGRPMDQPGAGVPGAGVPDPADTFRSETGRWEEPDEPPADSADEGPAAEGPADGPAMRPVWVAGAVVGVLLVLALAVALIVGSSGDTPRAAPQTTVTATVTASPSAPAPSATAPPSATPSVTPSVAPSGVPSGTAPAGPGPVTPSWTGTMTIVGPATDRDLDAAPPRAVSGDGGDLRADWLAPVLHAVGSARLAVLESGAPSGPSECAASAASSAASSTETLHAGDVVCVDTGRGHLARLVITRATQSSTAPTISAQVTVWPAPAAGPGQ